MSSLGDRIKLRRQTLKWTLDQLATKAKVSKGFLSDLENGKRKSASGEYLNSLSKALGVSLDYLISGSAPPPTGEQLNIPASLVAFAKQEHLTFSQTEMLLQLRRQILAFRSNVKSDDLEQFDWKPFYEDLKEHLQ